MAQTHPIQVVCEWIGNSQAVAAKHYLRVTESDFEQPAPKVAQKAAQQTHALSNSDPQADSTAHKKSPVLPSFASHANLRK